MTREETWKRLVGLRVVEGEMPAGQWNLRGADLGGADLSGADLRNTDIRDAELRVRGPLPVEQLATVRTLYEANLDPALQEALAKSHPHLFDAPT
jgi:hypothetical protein